MALIQCKNCGKEVSDRAKVCPGCGELLNVIGVEQEETVTRGIVCEECGTTFDFGIDSCPNCGCPVPVVEEKPDQEPQKVEVTSVNLQVKQSTKKYVIIAVVAVVLVALIALISGNVRKQKAEQAALDAAEAYKANLQLASIMMISGAADAESAGNLIKSVWYNSIYEERDTKTDKYTRPNGYFVSDFNDALGNLFSDPTFRSTISDIESNQETVASLMKELKNPTDEFEDAYDAIKDFYDAYLELTNLATSPTGSLQTFSNNFNAADSNVVKDYNAMEIYISD